MLNSNSWVVNAEYILPRTKEFFVVESVDTSLTRETVTGGHTRATIAVLTDDAFLGSFALMYNLEFLTGFVFDEAAPPYALTGPVRMGDNWGLIDRNGDTVLPFIFEHLMRICEDTAFAKYNGAYGIIDLTRTVPSPTSEEIRELLNSIPYAGMRELRRMDWLEEYALVVNSDNAIRIAGFITSVNGWWGPPQTSFHSPEEAGYEFLFRTSFSFTNRVQWNNIAWAQNWDYHPELIVLVPYLDPNTNGLILHSHIEKTARTLFGQELTIRPRITVDSPGMFHTYEWLGTYAYWQGAFGIPVDFITIILSYEYIGGGYEVACVFIAHAGEGYYERSFHELIAEDKDELMDYLRATTAIHTITLKNNSSGGFYYRAHILPEN